MAALAKRFVDRGVVVPLTYNDAYMGGNYATGDRETCEEGQEEGGDHSEKTGKGRCGVEIYGVDSYPQVISNAWLVCWDFIDCLLAFRLFEF